MKKKKQIIYEQVKKEWSIHRTLWDSSYHFFQAAKYVIDLFITCSSDNHTGLKACFEEPYALSFASRRSWFVASKAFGKSINLVEMFSSLSKAFLHFLAWLLENVVYHVSS